MSIPTMIRSCLRWPTRPAKPQRPQVDVADYPIRTREKLRFADTDRNGHIPNAVFAVCCQNARMELLHDRGRLPLPTDAQCVLVRLELEFLGEMYWPGTVEIGTRLERIGRSSLAMAQGLFLQDRCVARAHSTAVLIEPSTRRPMPLPQQTVATLRSMANGLAPDIAISRRCERPKTKLQQQLTE